MASIGIMLFSVILLAFSTLTAEIYPNWTYSQFLPLSIWVLVNSLLQPSSHMRLWHCPCLVTQWIIQMKVVLCKAKMFQVYINVLSCCSQIFNTLMQTIVERQTHACCKTCECLFPNMNQEKDIYLSK